MAFKQVGSYDALRLAGGDPAAKVTDASPLKEAIDEFNSILRKDQELYWVHGKEMKISGNRQEFLKLAKRIASKHGILERDLLSRVDDSTTDSYESWKAEQESKGKAMKGKKVATYRKATIEEKDGKFWSPEWGPDYTAPTLKAMKEKIDELISEYGD